MMDILRKHRRAVAVLVVCILVIFIGVLFSILSTKNSTNGIGTGDSTATGVDGNGEVISLPYKNLLYSISAPVNNTISIAAFSGYRNAAINKLYDFGINPTNYKITFNYESPFKNYEQI